MKTWIVFLAFLFVFNSVVFASERREFYNGIRGLAMGDSGIAIVNDETALLVNPAGLGKLRNFYGTMLDPEIDFSWKATDMYRVRPFSQFTNIDDVMPTVVQNLGSYYHARTQLMPSFVARNFGLGLYIKQNLDLLATTATSVETFFQDDMALALGYNFRFFDGRIKLGFNAKMVSRIEINEAALDSTAAYDTATLKAAGKYKDGSGISTDVGLIMTAPWRALPTISVVMHDMGGTQYSSTSGLRTASSTVRPATVAQDADVALALFPIHSSSGRSVWTVEYRNVLTASTETDPSKLYHLGYEYNLGDLLFLRAGYNQRYWTAGFELASERFQFQMASYGEEVGTAAANVEDRRYVMKFALRF